MSGQARSPRSSAARAILAALLSACLVLLALTSSVQAQQRVERRSLIELLFGRRVPEPPPEYIPMEPAPRRAAPQRKRPPASPPPAQARGAPPDPDQPAPVQKLDNARKVLVVGDFLASGLGEGLDSAFEASPGVVFETRGNVASGLVRRDYYDWQQQLPQMLDEVKPAIVVVMIGANDRQQIVDDALKEKFGSDAWFMAYEERVRAFAKVVTGRNIPLLWVGLPPFDSPSMTADAVRLNQIYHAQVGNTGGEFVDIWDGFTDENGKFVVTGSDVNGQQVRLRTADGINLTTSGRRKVAFYAEKSVRRLLGDQASPDIARLDGSSPADLAKLPPSETNQPERTQPIGVSDPALDGGAELLGATATAVSIARSPRDLLVEKGEMAPPPTGRVDDYRLPGSKPDAPSPANVIPSDTRLK